MIEKESETLVVICRHDFCRLLERVLRQQGVSEYRRIDLDMVCCLARKAEGTDLTEAFVITVDVRRR